MKKLTILIALLLVVSSANVFAQATANASATIITPISISKNTDMNFGNIVASAAPGTVVLTPAGARSITGGAFLPATAGTVAAASFTVTGANNFTYAITLPASVVVSDGGTNTMTVNTFASTPSGTGTLSAAGSETLLVGATLNVNASQVAGAYTSATPFTVTVNYN